MQDHVISVIQAPPTREASSNLAPDNFRALGHDLVDRIADFLARLPTLPVTPGESPEAVRALLPTGGLPERGAEPGALLATTADLLFAHSLFNGHPRFFGYVTSSPAPLGMLADLLAAAVNPNLGLFTLGPMATEIEAQAVRWIAELIGYPTDCGGLFVSGGNMANFVGLLAARTHTLGQEVRRQGMAVGEGRLRIYASSETHTWLQKTTDLAGLGSDAISWIPADSTGRIAADAVRERIAADRAQGYVPFCVVGTAGTVATGAVDPLLDLAELCREQDLWFHVDGAYGGFAAALAGEDHEVSVPDDLRGISLADSVAIDPHKWLYSPLEAGCVLVRRRDDLLATFSARPSYYHSAEGAEGQPPLNYHEHGPQNSRGFRALKVWLGLCQTGRVGVARQIADDITLAETLARRIAETPELALFTRQLSIATFRFVPADLTPGTTTTEAYLDRLNTALLERLQQGGEVFVSNAVLDGRFLLRACIVNFHTTIADVEALPQIVVRHGRAVDAELRGSLAQSR
jgi:glutamate/tyrosine decarboxylase-like PLP-dependent enzyme